MVELRCRAKINLYLRILGKRADGYHDIETIYHTIGLHDVLKIQPNPSGIVVECDTADVPVDESNLAFRAALKILEGSSRGVRITIAKAIPVAAGLGGGSADAAGTLVGINRLFDMQLTSRQIETLASNIGADVRFLIRGGCAIGRGRGDDLSFLEPLHRMPIILVIPGFKISTRWAYSSAKMELTSPQVSLTMITNALERGDVHLLRNLLYNDLEGVVFEEYPVVKRIKQLLLENGACGALMSGSGPVVFGIFPEEGDARKAKHHMEAQGLRVIVTSFAASGVTA